MNIYDRKTVEEFKKVVISVGGNNSDSWTVGLTYGITDDEGDWRPCAKELPMDKAVGFCTEHLKRNPRDTIMLWKIRYTPQKKWGKFDFLSYEKGW
jgi:hypothetical protein